MVADKARTSPCSRQALGDPQRLAEGQIRSFRIVKLDRATEKIELELA